jgi:predicted Ser/Thr protein kinase
MAHERAPESRDPDVLYDLYVSACLSGAAESPAEFCARHGAEDRDLRGKLQALYELVARPAAPGRDLPAEGDLPRERVGEFRLLRRLDRGGMGLVFLAEQTSLGRIVALKLMRPEYRDSPSAVERFRREARAAAKLQHDHIVRVLGFGEDRSDLFLAMEFVPGRSLEALVQEERVAGRPIRPARAAAWGRDLARALHYAHEQGIVHRDVKPSNVLIAADDRPMLLDFGIARDLTLDAPTLTAAFAGTPHYAAPEQLLGGPGVDRRADVYGLGATLYECLTGRPPHPAETLTELVRAVSAVDPEPPRRLVREIPRDLEVITLKALERDPARRYPSAAAMAKDLEALLEFRPIAARPAGLLARARKACRRRPVTAAVALTALLALVAGGIFLLTEQAAESARVRREAKGMVAHARALLEGYRASREENERLEAEVMVLSRSGKYQTPEEDRLLEEKEDLVVSRRLEREASFYEILELTQQAQRLDPLVAGAEEVRAELYLERWHDARAARDPAAERFYRELVGRLRAHLPADKDLFRHAALIVASDPPGAEAHLFRLLEQAEVVPGGDHRVVPVPVGEPRPPVAPGTWALRVVRGAGSLRAGDLVVSLMGHPIRGSLFAASDAGTFLVRALAGRPAGDLYDFETAPADAEALLVSADGIEMNAATRDLRALSPQALAERGGVEAEIFRDGALARVTLPEGLEVRATAAPALCSRASRLGATPVPERPIEPGRYLLVLRAEGFEERRIAFPASPRAPLHLFLRLAPEGSTPVGFVDVPYDGTSGRSFKIMEREVISAEYLEFVNDPDVAARAARLVPRSPANYLQGGYWPRGADDRFSLGEWGSDWPVLGITFEDAMDYAAWRSRRDGRRYSLPTFREWSMACDGGAGLKYVFGDRFRAKWVKCCFSRPRANPEPILRFPIDESPAGVFDLCGSAREWIDDWYDEGRGLRRLGGGSWGTGDPEGLTIYGLGSRPEVFNGENGFRLVLDGGER